LGHAAKSQKARGIDPREIFPGCVGFGTSSARGDMGAGLVSNMTLPVLHGVSVLLIGNWLGLQVSKPDDKQVNANGGFLA